MRYNAMYSGELPRGTTVAALKGPTAAYQLRWVSPGHRPPWEPCRRTAGSAD